MTSASHDPHPEGVTDTETVNDETFLTIDDVRIARREGDHWQPILPGYTIRETGEHLIITYPRSPAQ
jgi:hypothetical protein